MLSSVASCFISSQRKVGVRWQVAAHWQGSGGGAQQPPHHLSACCLRLGCTRSVNTHTHRQVHTPRTDEYIHVHKAHVGAREGTRAHTSHNAPVPAFTCHLCTQGSRAPSSGCRATLLPAPPGGWQPKGEGGARGLGGEGVKAYLQTVVCDSIESPKFIVMPEKDYTS